MHQKYLSFTAIIVLLLNILIGARPAFAEAAASSFAVVIVAIYPNAPGSAEKGKEFVTIANQGTETVSLDTLYLALQGKDDTFRLSGLQLEANEQLSVFPSFALPNGGGIIQLHSISATTQVHEATYPGNLTDAQAWVLNDATDLWAIGSPISAARTVGPSPVTTPDPEQPGTSPTEPDDRTEPEEPSTPTCVASKVTISEILPDPSGSDKNGGEFVELYNSATTTAKLEGCLLYTDKITTGYALPATMTIPAGGYLAIPLSDKLFNKGGTVLFTTPVHEDEVAYPTLENDEVWALIDDGWQASTLATPDAANALGSEVIGKGNGAATEPTVEAAPEPCPAGKFRNPETNRCKAIAATEAEDTLAACKEGQERNPETNRCRAIATLATTALTPCEEGEERNPATNRCRKITVATAPTSTNAQKTSVPASHPQAEAAAASERTTFKIILLAAGAALAYAAFEYRRDIANCFYRLKTRFRPPPASPPKTSA